MVSYFLLGPKFPGPNIPGPNIPGPNIPGPNIPGPNILGPNIPGPNIPFFIGTEYSGVDYSGTEYSGIPAITATVKDNIWAMARFPLSDISRVNEQVVHGMLLIVYFEGMLKFHTTAPDVYENFMAGKFSIKERPGRFVSVAGDQKLEQSINLSCKKSQSVIGNAKQEQFIEQCDLIFHEMADIHRLDVFIHHLSSSKITTCDENAIRKMIDVFEKYGNPLSNDAPHTLHNFVTKQAMSDGKRHDLLHYMEIGESR